VDRWRGDELTPRSASLVATESVDLEELRQQLFRSPLDHSKEGDAFCGTQQLAPVAPDSDERLGLESEDRRLPSLFATLQGPVEPSVEGSLARSQSFGEADLK
jgi:hypothetical protein